MLKEKFCLRKKIAKGKILFKDKFCLRNFLLKDKFCLRNFLLKDKFCLRTNFALETGVLQFFEVPPGGSVVSPFFSPFFLFGFVFCFCCSGWVAFFSHFFRIFSGLVFAFFLVICFF